MILGSSVIVPEITFVCAVLTQSYVAKYNLRGLANVLSTLYSCPIRGQVIEGW